MPITITRTSHAERRVRRQQIAEYVRSGHTLSQAARQFGVGLFSARLAAREHDVVATPRAQSSTMSILAALFARGMTRAAAAAECGVSRQYVSQIYAQAVAAGFPALPRGKGAPK